MIPFKDFIAEEPSNEYSAAKHKLNITKSRSGHYTVTVQFKNGRTPDGYTSYLKGKVGKLSTATHARNAIPYAIEDLHNEYKKRGYSIPK